MNTSYVGLFAGLILGVVAVTGGFLAFLGVAALGALGLMIGLIVEGRLDISGITGAERRRRCQATQATGRLTVKEAAVEKTAAYLAEQLEESLPPTGSACPASTPAPANANGPKLTSKSAGTSPESPFIWRFPIQLRCET